MPARVAESALIVGAGRVGTGLAAALARAGYHVRGTWNRTAAGARRTRRITGLRASSGALPRDGRSVDLVFLTVPDDALGEVCAAFASRPGFGPDQLVVHCSGASDLAPLAPARAAGAAVGSLHPLRAFADPRTAADRFPDTLAVVDGTAEVRRRLGALARHLGMRPAGLPPGRDARVLYHAAAVTAAGHLCAAMDLALELAEAAGLPPEDALDGLLSLARGALDGLAEHRSVEQAMTGPVARGDEGVLARHLGLLDSRPGSSRALYRALLARAREIAARQR